MEDNGRKRIYVYMHDSVTLLYGRNWHNIVNQLYSNLQKYVQEKATLGVGISKGKVHILQGCFLVAASSPVPTNHLVCRWAPLHPQACSSNRTAHTA